MSSRRRFEPANDAEPPEEPRASAGRLRVPAPSSHASGQLALRYQRLREVLTRYLSPVLVDSVLERAMSARGLSPARLGSSHIAELTSDIMIGLRLFVAESQLSALMLELAEILEAEER